MKCVLRIIPYILFIVCLSDIVVANNVRITRNVVVNGGEISNNIATLDFGVAWDNSWRDDFNWDAVYVFVKYRMSGTKEWKHVSLCDALHSVSDGFSWWTAKSATANDASGLFIYRDKRGLGDAFVDVKLRWAIDKDGLTKANFLAGQVEYSVMSVEMVYVPQGPFCIGDGRSLNTLGKKYRTILPEWDLIKNNGSLKFLATGDPELDANYINYPPENAANRVNETRSDYSNAWYATQGKGAVWGVEFPKSMTIRYFGVTGVRGHDSYRPTKWALWGSVNGRDGWTKLTDDLVQNDWTGSGEWDMYPIPNAIKLKTLMPCRFFQIRVEESSYAPMANCVAMTEVDIEKFADDSYIVDRQSTILMNNTTGFFTDAAFNGRNLNTLYPTGYEGFYAMKYEVTQEQYVRFLNKLLPNQQKNRTIGDALDALKEGEYVYGKDRALPNCRNGIKLATRVDGVAVFTNELDKDGDGKTLACNYLSPADMLAYASWTGLRPLSEMEYEKMVRGLYPEKPIQYEVAWNSAQDADIIFPSGVSDIQNPGMRTEKIATANVNAGNKLGGPVRVGSFAKGAGNQKLAGASYWGLMELSGNLAEIYYNVTTSDGQALQNVREAHGIGNLMAESTPATAGNTPISTGYWPQTPKSFMLRGGSFMTTSRYDLAVSAREHPDDYFSAINKKDSTATFRLGHSYTNILRDEMKTRNEQCTTYLKLSNGLMSATDGTATDYACVGTPYRITGSPLLETSNTTSTGTKDVRKVLDGKCDYVWWISENSGNTWRIVPGQDGQDFEYSDFGNDSPTNRTVWIKRQAITPSYISETKYIVLNVINTSYKISNLKDTIRATNQVKGFLVETKSAADFTWTWKALGNNSEPIRKSTAAGVSDYYFAERSNFGEKVTSRQNYTVICNMTFQKVCKRKVEVDVYIEDRPTVGISSNEIVSNGTGSNRCGVMMQDTRDGKIYGTVQIGTQCWMAENLRYVLGIYSKYQPQDPGGERVGVLYAWNQEVVNNACPAGWKLPTDDDMKVLNDYASGITNTAGKRLKAGNHWGVTTANKVNWGTNNYGLGLVGAGLGYSNGTFGEFQSTGYCITENNAYYYVNNTTSLFQRATSASSYYMSIRCIKR